MSELKRIFVKGGILSPNELKQIIHHAKSLGLDALHFGSRQDIILPEHSESGPEPDKRNKKKFQYGYRQQSTKHSMLLCFR